MLLVMMIVSLVKILDREKPLLAGRPAGYADHPSIQSAVEHMPAGEALGFDLDGTGFMSSSYFMAALWPFWTVATGADPISPFLVNVPKNTETEIEVAMQACKGAAWVVRLEHGKIIEPRVVGVVDPAEQQLLPVIKKRAQVSATDLFEADNSIGVTAWNNRLAGLYQRRLVRRKRDGKRLLYALPWR